MYAFLKICTCVCVCVCGHRWSFSPSPLPPFSPSSARPDTDWTIVLTDKALYKISDSDQIKRRTDLLELHSIDMDPLDPFSFRMYVLR